MIVKKYGNRRLYDTQDSRYITIEELAEKVRTGSDVRVVDAKTNDDLTQQTLAQIILESRGAAKLLPIPILIQLIRMGDDALAEFMGRYMAWALEVYVQVKQGALSLGGSLGGLNPLAALQMNPFARLLGGWGEPSPPPPPPPVSPPSSSTSSDISELRRELEELKRSVGSAARRRKR